MTRKTKVLVPATLPFWLKPFSIFGLLSVTMFIEHSHVFTIPLILAPNSVLMLTETSWPHGFDASLRLWVHCPEALYRSLPSRTSP